MIEPIPWVCRGVEIAKKGRPLIMGILNVTPDSFSDGGRYVSVEAAAARALEMAEQGADIIDVGGESTRPGALEVPADEEARRVVPVIAEIASKLKIPVSIDTRKASVAASALDAGARIINDVSGLLYDPEMPALAAQTGAGVVVMHMRGNPETMQNNPEYRDVVEDVAVFLRNRVEALLDAGLKEDTLCVDPGIGFGKTVFHNIELLGNIERFKSIGRPVLVGLSRKSFIGALTGCRVEDRLAGSLSAAVWCAAHGADVLRVHDVKETKEALAVLEALVKARR